MRASIASPMAPRSGPASAADHLPLPVVFVFAFWVAGLPVFLHILGQPLALVVCVSLALATAIMIEAHAPVVVLTATIFQNTFVSIASVNYGDIHDLDPMKSYNFVTTVVVWLAVMARFLNRRRSFSPFVRRMINASGALLAIFGIYFLAGFAFDARSSVVYMRNSGTPILLFQMFLVVAARHELALPRIVAILLGLLIVAGYIEFLAQDLWLFLTNGWHYFSLAFADRATSPKAIESGVVAANLLDYGRSSLFNSPLSRELHITVQRLIGPNLHPISFGYVLAALLSFAALHKRAGLALLAAPLLFMTSAKGPLALVVFSLAYCELARRWRPGLALKFMLPGLAAFAAYAFYFGVNSGDYHVLGLLGGLHGFITNPIGHTLGQGGNLSIVDFNLIDWSKYQHEGAADIAVESAVGVMLFQLGAAAGAVFAFYIWIARTSFVLYEETKAPALAFAVAAIATTLVNGLFQEEAYFAPLALGLVMGFAGLSLGAADRALASSSVARADPPPGLRPFARPPLRAAAVMRPAAMHR